MASDTGTTPNHLTSLEALEKHPETFGFFQALRRIECAFRDKPRLGSGARPGDEPVRIGQEPNLGFAPSALSHFSLSTDGKPAKLTVLFQGFFGPNGPLPLHLTEYARDRIRNAGDPTFSRFADVFHHRLLLLFYRAWAQAQPVVNFDREDTDRFATYAGSLFGGIPINVQDETNLDFRTRLFFSGHLSSQTKNPSSLASLLTAALGVKAEIEEFVGEWVSLPPEARWKLGNSSQPGLLGMSATLGGRAWMVQHKFRVVLGPLPPGAQREYLPGSEKLVRTAKLVSSYVGDELRWDLKLKLKQAEATRLGQSGSLGWTSFLTQISGSGDNSVVLEPSRPVSSAANLGV
jgi:type VI secretion system protein ImpH